MSKILVVDDIEPNRKLLRQMLNAVYDCQIVEAINGQEAVEKFAAESPDLVLMDINMPDMDGMQATSKIKALMEDNYVPVIFVTALSESALKDALASGGDDFISKPFDVTVLESKIRAHLRIRELNLQLKQRNRALTREQALIEHFFESAISQSYLNPDIINYHMSSMSTFNGDVLLSALTPQGDIYMIMGDFTGHGLTAAMGTLPVAMMFFKMTEKGLPLEDLVREINRQLKKLMPMGMFFAATVMSLNTARDKVSLWVGGMPELYWFNNDGELVEKIQSRHMALGILKDEELKTELESYRVGQGDKIYLYSDGITEARSSEGEMFGTDRFISSLSRHKEDRLNLVLKDLKLFTGMKEQDDDITLVELSCG